MARLILILVLLAGCASKLTPEQVEWRNGVDSENYRNCKQVYRNSSVPFKDYMFGSYTEIKLSLIRNDCKAVLGEYWASY